MVLTVPNDLVAILPPLSRCLVSYIMYPFNVELAQGIDAISTSLF